MKDLKKSEGKQRGGARPGAGRKPKPVVFANRASAREILDGIDEKKEWAAILQGEDLRLKLDALKYLTDRRDGKAAQSIHAELTGPNGASLAPPVLNISFVAPGA